ncbi:MAG: hypothetical protein WB699_04650 [Bacteroidota bacterium]
MSSLVSVIFFYLCAVLVGKFSGGRGLRTYTLLVLIALVQAAVVLLAMFLMNPPSIMKGVQ